MTDTENLYVSPLDSLPKDIFAHILTFLPNKYPLFVSSKQLQNTFWLVFCEVFYFLPNRCPLYFSELKSCQQHGFKQISLSIGDLINDTPIMHKDKVQVIQLLASPKISASKHHFENFINVRELILSLSPPSASLRDIILCFPKLEKIDFMHTMLPSDITTFPSQLISLTNFYSRASQPFQHLPHKLKELEWSLYEWHVAPIVKLDFQKLPRGLQVLKLGKTIDGNVPDLPPTVHTFSTGSCTFKPEDLPRSLQELYIQTDIGYPVEQLPQSLTKLVINSLKRPILHLPQQLKTLVLRSNICLPALPDSLTHLDIKGQYYYHLESFPKSLKVLKCPESLCIWRKFGSVDILPDSIQLLYLGPRYHRRVKHWPKSLKTLNLGREYDSELVNLPEGLDHLILSHKFNKSIDLFPDSITHLELGVSFSMPVRRWPANLKTLQCGKWFDSSLDNLPDSLTSLTVGWNFNQPFTRIPSSLTYLDLGRRFSHPLEHLSFNHLKILWFPRVGYFNHKLPRLPHVKELWLPSNFNQPIDTLPNALQQLTFGRSFNHPLPPLPPTLKSLHFGRKFNHPLDLPPSLTFLKLGIDFNSKIKPAHVNHKLEISVPVPRVRSFLSQRASLFLERIDFDCSTYPQVNPTPH